MFFLKISPRLVGLLALLMALFVALADLLLGVCLAALFALWVVLVRSRKASSPSDWLPGQPDRRRKARGPNFVLRYSTEPKTLASDDQRQPVSSVR